MGLLATRGRALGLRLRRPDQSRRHLLHGFLHAASVHDAASACRDTQRAGGHVLQQTPVYVAGTAAHVRLSSGNYQNHSGLFYVSDLN